MMAVSLANRVRTMSPFVLGTVGTVVLISDFDVAEPVIDVALESDVNSPIATRSPALSDPGSHSAPAVGDDFLAPGTSMKSVRVARVGLRKRDAAPLVDWML